MLGDACLETQNDGKTYRLKIEHSFKQKAYVDWKYEQFKDWVITGPQIRSSTNRTSHIPKSHLKYWFNTVSHAALRFYGQQFYRPHKIVPKMIHKMMTPRALAVWFMDDGSIKSKATKALILNTHGFTSKDVRRLQEMLCTVFHIETTLRKQKDGTQLYIPADQSDAFRAIITPYVIPEMMYKVNTCA